MQKWDPKKDLKALYAPRNLEFAAIEVPEMAFLSVDGHGDPNTEPSYRHAVEALYAVSFAAKFGSKNELGRDYVVAPLEGLWWASDLRDFETRNKAAWEWTMLIMQPEWVTADIVEAAMGKAARKDLPALPLLRFERQAEGACVQALHVGSYDDEAPSCSPCTANTFPPTAWWRTGTTTRSTWVTRGRPNWRSCARFCDNRCEKRSRSRARDRGRGS